MNFLKCFLVVIPSLSILVEILKTKKKKICPRPHYI